MQARNEAEQLTYSAEKNLSEYKDSITAEIKQEIEAAVAEVRAVKESESLDDVKAKTEALSKAVQKIGQHMAAQSAGAQSEEGAGGGAEGGSEDKSKGG